MNRDWDDEEEHDESSEFDSNEDDGTVPCPNCGKEMYEDSPRCPYCGEYVTHVAPSVVRSSPWMMIGMVLALLMALGWMLLPHF
ncbi:zinc-ribbon domain-containing protein [bacterium]|nr:zinc-ribbon domain-containing protein [bacterium]